MAPASHFISNKSRDSAQWCFRGEQSYKGAFSYTLLRPLLRTCALPSRLDLLVEGKSSNAMTLSNRFPTTLQSLLLHVCRDDGAPACFVQLEINLWGLGLNTLWHSGTLCATSELEILWGHWMWGLVVSCTILRMDKFCWVLLSLFLIMILLLQLSFSLVQCSVPDSFRCLMTRLWGDGKLSHADPFCLLFRGISS